MANAHPTRPNVLQLLRARPSNRDGFEPRRAEAERSWNSLDQASDAYVAGLMQEIDAGRQDIRRSPIISNGDAVQIFAARTSERQPDGLNNLLDAAANVVLRPSVFAWVPERLFPGLQIACPFCGAVCLSTKWATPRKLHTTTRSLVYVTVKYRCRPCKALAKNTVSNDTADPHAKPKLAERSFQADCPQLLSRLPHYVRDSWQLIDTGRILCDASVLDMVRALATRTSWSAIADAINEMKTQAWQRIVARPYLALCDMIGECACVGDVAQPDNDFLSAAWIRDVYMADFASRRDALTAELTQERGDDVLAVDWTVDAASRCGSKYLFNAMDGKKRILISSLMDTCHPQSVAHLMQSLAERGVQPKTLYVDCECCGAWARIAHRCWPSASVRLDGMHAIRRLTQTTTSTQHPWHEKFCAALSGAVYTYDEEVLAKLQTAYRKQGLRGPLPGNIKSKYVPRVITNARRIADAIDAVLQSFATPHTQSGPLLTSATGEAWRELRRHVMHGCLCDPPGMHMHELGEEIVVYGDKFRIVRTLRGTSALEGFHTHQKAWLGNLARHAADAGAALLADGAVRWNRKRKLAEQGV